MPEDLKKKVYAVNEPMGKPKAGEMETIKENQWEMINGNTILILMLNNRKLKERFSELENRALETMARFLKNLRKFSKLIA